MLLKIIKSQTEHSANLLIEELHKTSQGIQPEFAMGGHMVHILKKINALIGKGEEYFLIGGITAMGVIMTMQVFSRSVLGSSIVWSEELTRHIFIWTTFIGMSYGINKLTHVRLDYFQEKLPFIAMKAVSIVMDVFVTITLLYLFRYSLIYVKDQMDIVAPALGYPMGFVMLVMPISCVLSIQRIVINIYRTIKKTQSQEITI